MEQRTPKGARDSERTLRSRSGARTEPERSPNGERTPKGARDSERTFGVPKLHYSETAKSPVVPGKLNALQAHQTPMSLPIYMGTGTVALCKTDPVIEHKRCPTGKISQQQNQSPNRPVQNANTSHDVEACRLRAGRRATLRAGRRAVLRVERRAGLRAGRRAVCAPGDAPFCALGDAPVCAPGDAPVARRKTRQLRAGRRAVCAPRDAPCARRETRRLHAACARGPVRSFCVEAGGASKLLAGGSGGWLTAPPPTRRMKRHERLSPRNGVGLA